MTLELMNINKFYSKNKQAISNLNLKLESGVLGLLGPNGAGKSTLMKMISTISQPSSGQILYNQQNIIEKPDHIRKDLGYLPQDFGVYDNLNAYEFLRYIAALKGIDSKGLTDRINYFLDAFNLMAVAKKQLGTYSGGMKQRIGIAQALLNDPKIVLFDEPTVGLDPQERVRFRQLISELSQNRIIILSSHIVSDIESISDQIAIMKNGEILAKGTMSDTIANIPSKIATAIVEKSAIKEIQKSLTIIDSKRHENSWKIRFILNQKRPDFNFEIVDANLEDSYLYYTKDEIHAA